MRNYLLFLIALVSAVCFANLPPTALKGGNEAGLKTTFNFNLGAMPVTRNGTSVTFGTMPVSGGGTGLTSLAQYSILSGDGQSPVNPIMPSASGTLMFSTGAGSFPIFRSLTYGDVSTALGFFPVESIAANEPFYLTGPASSPTLNMYTSGAVSGSLYTKVYVDGYGRVTSGSTLINSDLPDSGVAAATYPKVTVNSKGVVTSGTVLTTSDLPYSGVVSGAYTKVQVTSAGTITSGTTLVESDIPNLQTTKITSGVFTVANGGTGSSSATTAFDNLAPSTSKGDLLGHNGTNTDRLPVGTNGQYLVADSTNALGIAWTSTTSSTSPPTVNRYTTFSNTYTTPAGAKYLKVYVAGGGGGTGTASNGNGSGSSFVGGITSISGAGGSAGLTVAGVGGDGGLSTVSGATIIMSKQGERGQGSSTCTTNVDIMGAQGGGTLFAAGGAGGYAGNAVSVKDGPGAGAGGMGCSGAGSLGRGGGGGGGSSISMIYAPLAASYAVIVGSGGVAGTSGGPGASGTVVVETYY